MARAKRRAKIPKRRIKVEVEPFSMKNRVSVGSVKTRWEDGEAVPAVCVKPPPLYHRIPADLRERADQRIIDDAFESVAQQWWDMVPQEHADYFLRPAHRGSHPIARSAGRSSGWVVVSGIGSPSDWTERQVRAWGRFAAAIKKSMEQAEQDFHEEIRKRTR